MKKCSKCNNILALACFYLVKNKRMSVCKECISIKNKKNYIENKPILMERVLKHFNNKKLTDLVYKEKYRLRKNLRTAIIKAQKTSGKINKKTYMYNIIGMSYYDLSIHFNSLFKEGMSWSNTNEWQIDHVIPLCTAKTIEEVRRLFHYTNLQPLWIDDNVKKGTKN